MWKLSNWASRGHAPSPWTLRDSNGRDKAQHLSNDAMIQWQSAHFPFFFFFFFDSIGEADLIYIYIIYIFISIYIYKSREREGETDTQREIELIISIKKKTKNWRPYLTNICIYIFIWTESQWWFPERRWCEATRWRVSEWWTQPKNPKTLLRSHLFQRRELKRKEVQWILCPAAVLHLKVCRISTRRHTAAASGPALGVKC